MVLLSLQKCGMAWALSWQLSRAGGISDVALTNCSYQCPRIKLGSALILIAILILILPRACWIREHLVYISTRFSLDRRFGSILIWGESICCFRVVEDEIWYFVYFLLDFSVEFCLTKRLGSPIIWANNFKQNIGGFVNILGLIYWTTIESFSFFWSYTDFVILQCTLDRPYFYQRFLLRILRFHSASYGVEEQFSGFWSRERQFWFEIDVGYLRHVPCLNKQGSVWCTLVERYHDVHTGRGNIGLCRAQVWCVMCMTA